MSVVDLTGAGTGPLRGRSGASLTANEARACAAAFLYRAGVPHTVAAKALGCHWATYYRAIDRAATLAARAEADLRD